MLRNAYLILILTLAVAIDAGAAAAAGRMHGGWHGNGFHRGGSYLPYYGFPYYDGGYVIPSIDNWTPFPPTPQLPSPPPPLVPPTLELTCHRSQQMIVVPSEAGGSRQVTITRC